MSDGDAGGDGTPPDPSTPPHRLVAGTAAIDDLDAFLAALDEIAGETGAVVQAFDADLVVSAAHLREATRLAARSIARGEAVARDPGVEIMLYAAGSRQIDRALTLGVEAGEQRAVVLVAEFGAGPGAGRSDADLDAAAASVAALLSSPTAPVAERGAFDSSFDPERVREFYDIGEREIAATAGGIPDIVRERVALLDVEK
ncbi:hypothetical protein DJ69_03995 [Halorubrum persicum]|uniref:KEOPS complex component n=1 Tax=Halorubrum persicum TaxID=1383844 RepID=A0A2G1WLK5_9EURY|nr:KEOPS complex subunit Cgi121 [Halorubrum persicum]PHQ39856.1 hypothetical protein DJ69_03995 [Halorubrum persicum]